MADGETYARAATEAPSERIAKMEIRLENGQREFMALREEQRSLRAALEQQARDLAPKPLTRLQVFGFVAGPVLGVVVLLGGYVWNAARYPDRAEFNAALQSAADASRAVDRRLNAIESAQALQAKDLSTIGASADRNEKGLDKLADRLERQLAATKGK
jgi:hypothetical protein